MCEGLFCLHEHPFGIFHSDIIKYNEQFFKNIFYGLFFADPLTHILCAPDK